MTKVLETELYNGEESKEVEIPSSECMIVINSNANEEMRSDTESLRGEVSDGNGVEEFYDSITKSYLEL